MLGRTVFRSKSRRAQFREEHLRKAWEASERSELKDVVVTDETAVRFRRYSCTHCPAIRTASTDSA